MEWDRMFDVSLCEGEPLGLVDGRFLFLDGKTKSPDASRLLVYDSLAKECKELPMYDDQPVKMALSYVEDKDAFAILLPKGNLVSGSRIVNNANVSDTFFESITVDDDSEEEDFEGDMEEEEFHWQMCMLEEAKLKLADLDDNGISIIHHDAPMVNTDPIDIAFQALLPKTPSDCLEMKESYSMYLKLIGLPENVVFTDGDNHFKEYQKFVHCMILQRRMRI